jgi:hypothetical protein
MTDDRGSGTKGLSDGPFDHGASVGFARIMSDFGHRVGLDIVPSPEGVCALRFQRGPEFVFEENGPAEVAVYTVLFRGDSDRPDTAATEIMLNEVFFGQATPGFAIARDPATGDILAQCRIPSDADADAFEDRVRQFFDVAAGLIDRLQRADPPGFPPESPLLPPQWRL